MESRIYAPKPTRGVYEEAISLLPVRDRARYRAAQLAAAHSGSLTWTTDDGVTITASRWRDDSGVFEVAVAASDDRAPLPLDNPYRFVNPPLKVPDGTWRKETVDGTEVDVPNDREDLLGAARSIITEAVRTVALREGWSPSQR